MTTAALIADLERIHAELQATYADAYWMLTDSQRYHAQCAMHELNSLTASLRKQL